MQLNTNAHTYMYLPNGHVTNGDLFASLVGQDKLSDGHFVKL